MAKEHKTVTTRHYLFTFAALIALATLSLLLSVLPVRTGLGVALVIGLVKAVLVLGWFMHLVEENFGAKLFMCLAAGLVVTLLVLTALDPLTRAPYPPAPAANVEFRAGALP